MKSNWLWRCHHCGTQISAASDQCLVCDLDNRLQAEIDRCIKLSFTILLDKTMPEFNQHQCRQLIDDALAYAITAKKTGNNLARKRALEILRGYD